MIPPVLHTPGKDEKLPLTVRFYGKQEASWCVYDDDGETFDYERGTYFWAPLTVKRDKKGRLTGSWTPPKHAAFHYTNVDWQYMTR